jgi:hypothetical protein
VFFGSVFGLQTGKIEALILEQNPTNTLVGFFYARISNGGRRGSGISMRLLACIAVGSHFHEKTVPKDAGPSLVVGANNFSPNHVFTKMTPKREGGFSGTIRL